jgi:thiol:disulfide interchange protein
MRHNQNLLSFYFLRLLVFFVVSGVNPLLGSTSRPFQRWEQSSAELKKAIQISFEVNSSQDIKDGLKEIEISLLIETFDKFKIYEESLKFEILSENSLTPVKGDQRFWSFKELDRPPVRSFLDPISRKVKMGFQGQNEFKFKFTNQLKASKIIPLGIMLQVCSDKICLFPSRIYFEMPLNQEKAPTTTTNSPEIQDQTENSSSIWGSLQNRFSETLRKSVGGPITWIILFLSGLLTAFTPCVYPLYPITLGIFSRWLQVSEKEKSPFKWVIVYCLGLIFSYSILGLFSAATGSLFGSFTQSPPFLVGIGVLILISAIVFSGWFNFLGINSFLAKIQNTLATAQGPVNSAPRMNRVFVMGASLGLVASPCVGPVLVALLSWLSQILNQGTWVDYVLGFGYLSIFGMGMSFPFLILGHLLFKNQKRLALGPVTSWVKNIGTALMLVASFYFLNLGLSNYFSKPIIKESAQYPKSTLETWTQTKPSILDFRADWCVACIELETLTFSDPLVRPIFEKGEWEMVRIDLTEANDLSEEISKKYNLVGLPTVKFWIGGKFCESLTLYGFEDAKQFSKRISKAITNCE